jgi:[ribosomal protein S5]-alanine N-acetyltransferase
MSPELYTERLVLRAPVQDDIPFYFELRSNPDISRYLNRPLAQHLSEAAAFVENIMSGTRNKRWYYWTICEQAGQNPVGTICLWNFALYKKEAEIGYELLPEKQGKGIMQEAMTAVVQFSFETLHFDALNAWVESGNSASLRLLERSGFLFTETKMEDGAEMRGFRKTSG